MNDPHFNPVQFGQLLQAVEALTEDVKRLSAQVESQSAKVDALNELKHTGRGILLGALIGGGSLGAVAAQWLERLR